ncbi:undecaprenyl-phosphate glucose phosphotransferase [Massilia haematophila]|uniref:Undecaprenyl-phosphate glucose phosphotransferase n=1 Tax=Massilia haematophila TaxID=457923 RepID=A0ABV7PKG7_9BURK
MNNLFEQTVEVAEDEPEPRVSAAEPQAAAARHRHPEHSGKHKLPVLMNALRLADIGVLLLAGFGGYYLRFGYVAHVLPESHLFIYLSTLLTVVSLHVAQAYDMRSIATPSTLLSSLLAGSAAALLLMLFCGYLSGTLHFYSRAWLGFSIGAAAILLLLNRIVVIRHIRNAARGNRLTESVVVVGANEHAEKMLAAIQGVPHSAILPGKVDILGVFDDRIQREVPASLRSKMLGSTDAMLHFIRRNHVDRVVVALPWVASDRIDSLLRKLRTVPVQIDLVPSDMIWQFSGINMERLGCMPVVTIANGRVIKQMGAAKRIEDLAISSSLLLLLGPLLLLIALAIKLDSKGPVIFKQRRHGFNNEVFEVYKFRSMTAGAPPSGKVIQAVRNDPRVTRLGKLLRRTSLDELPQLFNVLLGNMSIVGPRPHAVEHNIEYGSIISEYFGRHNVKPGITGWAQISGLRGETDTVEKMHRRVQFDLHYIENWSLGFDLKILLMTAVAVWTDPNAY